MSSLLKLSDVHFAHSTRSGVHSIFNGLSLELGRGENLSVIGPSGCGKSTLLFLLSGLLRPKKGEILFNGEKIEGPSRERMIVFQNHALLPWLTCLKNVIFSLETSANPPADLETVALSYLQKVGLEKFADFYPSELSGGMQQRLGIARALATEPKLLLLDEPFSSLDALTRNRIFDEMSDLLKKLNKSAVFVTHDVGEALRFAEKVLVLGGEKALFLSAADIREGEIYEMWADRL